jgi:hypothetical protein
MIGPSFAIATGMRLIASRFRFEVLFVGSLLSLAACTASQSEGAASGPGSGYAPVGTGTGTTGGVVVSGGSTGAAGSESGGAGSGSAGSTGAGGSVVTGSQGGIQPGTLTAGTWDDNLNYAYYLSYLQRIEAQQIPGLPIIPRANRLEITVTDPSGAPIGNASVAVSGTSGTALTTSTRPDGKAFFFPPQGTAAGDPLQVVAHVGGTATATGNAAVGDATLTLVIPGVTAARAQSLDLAIVIDTTGSMGDELAYLQVEVNAIAARVAQDFPSVAQRLALILYRDNGDQYVVRSFDFTTSLATFQNEISAQSADGGGDYPESPDKALAQLAQLTWDANSVARMAFWIADAPHHADRAPVMVQDILAQQTAGVRLYPVAASGTDDLLEYTMRTAAEVTGGRYLFLTNDSGIGNDHKEPTIPCYQVTSLDKAMLRMITMELTGTQIEPAAADVIRVSGDIQNGQCAVSDGSYVTPL